MRNPWLAFTGICTLVLGIVLFSVVFGGYSSLLRSQNRIEAAKQLLADQWNKQILLVNDWIEKESSHISPPTIEALISSSKSCEKLLSRIKKEDSPLSQEIVLEFETMQARLNKNIAAFVSELKVSASLSADKIDLISSKALEMETGVFIMGKRYNKEARYFNTRTQVFPGRIIAQLFALDKLFFPEISVNKLAPEEVASAS